MESQLLSLLDYDLRITSDDLKTTLKPLIPLSPRSLNFPLPPSTRTSLRSQSRLGMTSSRHLAAISSPSQAYGDLNRLGKGDWDIFDSDDSDDSDDEEELVEEPPVIITIPGKATEHTKPHVKLCDPDSPLDPYTSSPLFGLPYAHIIYPQRPAVADFENENEVDTLLRPFGLDDDVRENWLEGLVDGWEGEGDEDDEDEMEEMERDDGEEEEAEAMWPETRVSSNQYEEDMDDELSSYSLSRVMSVQSIFQHHDAYSDSHDYPIHHPAPNFHPITRRFSTCSSISTTSTLSLATPTDFHSDFVSVSLEPPVVSHKRLQYNNCDIVDNDSHTMWPPLKHGMRDAPKRPWNPNLLNSKPPVSMMTTRIPSMVDSSKECKPAGIFARVFRQAARHR